MRGRCKPILEMQGRCNSLIGSTIPLTANGLAATAYEKPPPGRAGVLVLKAWRSALKWHADFFQTGISSDEAA
jgi:hypothetical protein